MIKAIIFDLDGVIIDSEPFWAESIDEIIKEHNLNLPEEVRKSTIGFRINKSIEFFNTKLNWGLNDPNQITDQIIKRVSDKVTKLPLMPGVQSLFNEIKDLNLPCGIASSSPYQYIKNIVEKFDLSNYIQHFHSAEFEENGKPFPDVYLTTIKKLNQIPTECLAIEDTKNGLKAAQAAGMKTVLVPHDYFLEENLNADLVVKRLSETNLSQLLKL